MSPCRRPALPVTRRGDAALAMLLLLVGAARLGGAETPATVSAATADPGAQHLAEAVANRNLMQERLTSALTANHPAAEIASLRQTLFDDENEVLDLRYTPIMTTLLKATFANDLAGFQAVCTKGMSDFMTSPILGSSHGYLIAAVPDQQYTLRYSGSYHKGSETCLFYVLRPAVGGNDLTFLLTVQDDKCAGLEMH